jgi:hypothetical protein
MRFSIAFRCLSSEIIGLIYLGVARFVIPSDEVAVLEIAS